MEMRVEHDKLFGDYVLAAMLALIADLEYVCANTTSSLINQNNFK